MVVSTRCAVLLGGLILGIGGGCGPGEPAAGSPEIFQNAALTEVGSLIESYMADAKKPPTKQSDLAKYEPGLPSGWNELKKGNIVVFWGVPLASDDTSTVLAYEKATPDSGGLVLMKDGKTIQKMTAEEFKAAPKAGTPDSASSGAARK
jgi:hypothetical protein